MRRDGPDFTFSKSEQEEFGVPQRITPLTESAVIARAIAKFGASRSDLLADLGGQSTAPEQNLMKVSLFNRVAELSANINQLEAQLPEVGFAEADAFLREVTGEQNEPQ